MNNVLLTFCLLGSGTTAHSATLVAWDFVGNNPADHAENTGSPGEVIADAATYATPIELAIQRGKTMEAGPLPLSPCA